MDVSADWDVFLEWEGEAIEKIKELQERLQENPEDHVSAEEIDKIKGFFRQYSSDEIFWRGCSSCPS
jgi:hypothetical protein